MSKFTSRSFNIESLVKGSFQSIEEGAYDWQGSSRIHDIISLRKSILSTRHAPIITEIKYASPSHGKLRNQSRGLPEQIASLMVNSGAVALSVLTQPNFFEGSINFLAQVRKSVAAPLLMKDIIVSRVQIEAGKRVGADAILLIKSIFDLNLAEESLETLYEFAKNKGLEVIVEAHSETEYDEALKCGYELVGINNRNLATLQVDISTTERLIKKFGKGRKSTIISESGIRAPEQLRILRKAGADAFLIGTSIMKSDDIARKVHELYNAI